MVDCINLIIHMFLEIYCYPMFQEPPVRSLAMWFALSNEIWEDIMSDFSKQNF